MRAPRTLRTALVATGVTTALSISAAGAFAIDAPAGKSGTSAAPPSRAERVYVQTVQLADHISRAKVYKAGTDRYEAEIWAGEERYGALYTQGRAAYAQHNGLHITLHPDGKVTSWVERAKPRPKPVVQRVLVATATLADGATTAKLYRVTADHHEADILADGVRLDTLVTDGHGAAYGENNGLHVALQPDGQLTSWVDAPPSA
ncbi:hypothetical protein ACM01_16515 [Streptomyces viridochromogenes]|uniref:Uncharacterized protein n=1 Tax=Streptomyces viridochromogenes TaxID=1938 RepID=A0A0J7ZCY1_STRVR|nr:hypothetical protein [Streptomyces viridochromogenes]KMS73946.1 hypothetical protein ACM01_16515 [Streptomyces viridochromogenes]KOG11017.1 hypothetical protein ADK35_36980 [Streptomyces viridochromogenes]KOG26046.1 hypothetical protein ADK36_04050 [Streptomyces viridochromogenes]